MTGWIEVLALGSHTLVVNGRHNQSFFSHNGFDDPLSVRPGNTRPTVGEKIRAVGENLFILALYRSVSRRQEGQIHCMEPGVIQGRWLLKSLRQLIANTTSVTNGVLECWVTSKKSFV